MSDGSNSTGTISLEGASATNPAHRYLLTLSQNGDEGWVAMERNDARNIVRDRGGKWDFHRLPTRGVTCVNSRNEPVLTLLNLDPDEAAVGQMGRGNAHQTAVEITWKVTSI